MIWWKLSDPQMCLEYDVSEVLGELPAFLRVYNREEAATMVEQYRDKRADLLNALSDLGRDFEDLVKAAEKFSSSDWGIGAVDDAVKRRCEAVGTSEDDGGLGGQSPKDI